MLELWIDKERCDISSIPKIPIGFDIEKLSKADGYRTGRSIEIELPATPLNNAIFGASRDIYATSRFNTKHHTAILKKDGVEIFSGTVYLCGTEVQKGAGGGYKICIMEGGAAWIERVSKSKLSDLNIAYSEMLGLSAITKSWEGESVVRFLPVYRDNYISRYSEHSVIPAERVMLTDDYHPFISISEMVRAMFAGTGYTLHSHLFDSEFGRSLYMSGDYARSDAELAKSRCDFFARRSAPTTAKADYTGRVFASTAFAANTVGPIVDTANPEAIDSDGIQMSETFNTLNAFSKNEAGNICFKPRYSVKAGFMLHLEYTTDYKILSRERLLGFDYVEGLENTRVKFPLANTCVDHRKAPSKNKQYRVLVFDHIEDREYMLSVSCSNNNIYNSDIWSARSQLVVTPKYDIESLQLLYRSGNSAWQVYTEDWALYAGYIEEEGKVDVVLDFRLPPQSVAANEEYLLDKIWFGGAEQGMEITVSNRTTLRPYFTTVPGYGSQLQFADIAPRQVSQIELLTALGEMFNLAFYTDEQHKEVHIEPLEELYGTEEVDWSNRIDWRHGITLADTGIGRAQNYIFSYRDTDKATNEYNLDNDTLFGSWKYSIPLYGTKESTKQLGNSLFTTTINKIDIVGTAPSASLMVVGDTTTLDAGIDEPFTPHIVCYKGLRALPDGECWIASEKLDHYPYATFSDGESINLCFEDREGLQGLNRYHTDKLARLCNGQTLTLDLHLTTAEIASLFTADGTIPSLRTRFRFTIQGESSLFRLAKIESWNTDNATLRCTFERELKD